jgi:quinol monooxygenase YgiN
MSDFVVVATFVYKPEAVDQAIEHLTELANDTHAKEEGALLYSFHQDRENPAKIVVIEHWASQEAFDAHGQTPHIQKVGEWLPALIAEPPSILILDQLGLGDPKKGRIGA